MPINPNIPLQAMTPADAKQQHLSNQIKEQQVQKNEQQIQAGEDAQGQPNYDEIEKKMEIGMKLISTVRDQSSYDRAKQLAQQYGIQDLEMLPEVYDPQIIEQLGRASMTFQEQMQMQRQQQMGDFQREKFDYEKGQDAQNFEQKQQQFGQTQDRHGRADDLAERKVSLAEREFEAQLEAEEQEAANPASNLEPMPVGALKELRDDVAAIGLSGSINSDLNVVSQQLESGQLDLGFFKNIGSKARNIAGNTTEQSRNFDSFKATLTKLRNDSLRLNKGVQTEGDAQRSWDELIANINDNQLVRERIAEIQQINKRGAELKKMGADMIRQNYGRQPLPELIFEQPSAIGGEAGTGQDKGYSTIEELSGNGGGGEQGGGGGQGEDPITAELRRRGVI